MTPTCGKVQGLVKDESGKEIIAEYSTCFRIRSRSKQYCIEKCAQQEGVRKEAMQELKPKLALSYE